MARQYIKKIKPYRVEALGSPRFLTFSCYHNQKLFQYPELCLLFLDHLKHTREKRHFKLMAWVIMPNHVHLLLKPAEEDTVRAIMLALKTKFSYGALNWLEQNQLLHFHTLKVRRGAKMVRRFWQEGGGFDRNLYNAKGLQKAIEYIHMNPVHAGLVENIKDWPWSSLHFYAGVGEVLIELDEAEWWS